MNNAAAPSKVLPGKGKVRAVGADCRARGAGDMACPVDDYGADAVAGQEPGEGAGAAADIDDDAAARGGHAAGDEGMDVTSRGEPLGGCLGSGEAPGVGVVVAGQRLARARLRRLPSAHGLSVPRRSPSTAPR